MKKSNKVGTTLRVSPGELKLAKKLANHLNMKVSDYFRFALYEANKHYKKQVKKWAS